MNDTCFVIMPIGDQIIGKQKISATALRERYEHVIKKAIKEAMPDIAVVRSDDELNPSSISNDILLKLMHSTYVIADITYPNPNVFYELGIRHAIGSRTILLKEDVGHTLPFDISHMRCIQYSTTPAGLVELSKNLKTRFEYYSQHPDVLDNQFLELCSFTKFVPTVYKNIKDNKSVQMDMLVSLMSDPTLSPYIFNNDTLDDEGAKAVMETMLKDPDKFAEFLASLD